MRLIYATRLSFLDHWGCDLSVSHLASVATRECLSFSTAISIKWMKEWSGKRYFTALDMRPCQWITVDGQFEPRFVCQWEFFLGNPMFGPIVEETKKKQVFPIPWRIPTSVLLSFCLSCFWAFNLKLECPGGYELSWTCNDDRLMLQNFHALRYSETGYVERSWRRFNLNEFVAEAWNFSWRYGWAGL